MRTLSLALLLSMTLTCRPAFGRTLTLSDCVQLVMERNSALKSSRAASKSAAEEVTGARAALLPSLMLKSQYSIFDRATRLLIDPSTLAPGVPPQKTSLPLGSDENFTVGLYLRQPLFTGGNLTGARQFAEHEAAAAEYDHSRQRTLLLFQVTKTFNEALIAACRIQAAERAVQSSEARFTVARARHKEGYADSEEVLRREADLAMAQTRLIKSRNRSFLVLGKLRQLTGSGPEEEIEVAGKPAKLIFSGGLDDLTKGVGERREDLRSAAERTAAAGAGVAMSRSAFYPQLFLEGSYLRQKETPIARPEVWSLTVQAEWSLFEWGRTSSSVRKAVDRQSQLDLEREELSRSARLEIEETWRDVAELQSQVIAHEKVVRAIEEGLIKSINSYLDGAVRFDEVSSVESTLWEAYDTYCQSAASLSSAFAALEASTSAPLGRWTTTEELYRPDFESYAYRIKSHEPAPRSTAKAEEPRVALRPVLPSQAVVASQLTAPAEAASEAADALVELEQLIRSENGP